MHLLQTIDQKIALHQTAAEFLAHAALDLFPNAHLLGGQGTSRYFYYDFHLSLEKQSLPLIEERMAYLLKTHKKIDKREMLSSNAVNLFASRGQFRLAEKLKHIQGLIQICQIADFLDFCPYPFSQIESLPLYFKLFDIQKISSHIVRIIGTLSSEKTALKNFLKQNPSPSLSHHLRFTIDKKLFSQMDDGAWIWLPNGEVVRQLLLKWWQERIAQEKFKRISSSFSVDSFDAENGLLRCHQECFLKSGCDKLAEILYLTSEKNSDYGEGLFETTGVFTDRLTQFFSDENFLERCISSLHFILEMPRILGFEFQITLGQSTANGNRKNRKQTSAYRIFQAALEKVGLDYIIEKDYKIESETWIEIKIFDALGRLWDGPFMSISTKTKVPLLVCSVFGSMERLVGLILERYAGSFPLWLAPEQVRLIPLGEKAHIYASHIHQTLQAKGIRSKIDIEATDLGRRLYRANGEKVPFAVILGDKELQAQTLVVKILGSEQEERMSVSALCERIKNSECGVSSEPEN